MRTSKGPASSTSSPASGSGEARRCLLGGPATAIGF
jgi:hypothetical protein